MNFDFVNYPELKIFTKSFDFSSYKPNNFFSLSNDIVEEFKNNYIDFFIDKIDLNNIYYFSDKMISDIHSNKNGFRSESIYEFYCNNVDSESGIILLNNQSYFFYFEPENGKIFDGKKSFYVRNCKIALFSRGNLVSYLECNKLNEDGLPITRAFSITNLFSATDVISDILAIVLFLRYVNIETKNIFARKKNVYNNIKLTNNTPLNFKYITSNYFTNLIRSSAFGVNGHWRFQKIGKGRKDVKLIWIDSFIKKGYNRTADKIRWEK